MRFPFPILGFAMLAVALLPPRVHAQPPTDARGYDQVFDFSLSSYTLSGAMLMCEEAPGRRAPLADEFQEAVINEAVVGPYTDLTLTLEYPSVSGPYSNSVGLQIDNDTRQILEGGSPVTTLFDIYGPTPAPAGPVATLRVRATRSIVLVLRAVAAI